MNNTTEAFNQPVKLHRVCKRYPNGHQALSHVSLTLNQGELVFLTGHSGAGKSTLLRLITLTEKPNSGLVIVNGYNLANLTKRQQPVFRRTLGIVLQDDYLLNDRNVFTNVSLPLEIIGCDRMQRQRRVRAALERVGLLIKANYYPCMLSAGERQRVAIARAIVHRPALIIADEPTGNLDANLSEQMVSLLYQFVQVGTTVLIATHDLKLVDLFPARQIRLARGQLLAKGQQEQSVTSNLTH